VRIVRVLFVLCVFVCVRVVLCCVCVYVCECDGVREYN